MTERAAEDWGRVAVGLPGWEWPEGALPIDGSDRCLPRVGEHWEESERTHDRPVGCWPDVDDPATAGCLLAMLGQYWIDAIRIYQEGGYSLGESCIAAAEALGRWPG